MIAQKISEDWKQGVIVDNHTGAGGIVASEMLAHSLPDGYSHGQTLCKACLLRAELHGRAPPRNSTSSYNRNSRAWSS